MFGWYASKKVHVANFDKHLNVDTGRDVHNYQSINVFHSFYRSFVWHRIPVLQTMYMKC